MGGPHRGRNILVDTTPEMRLQVLRAGVGRVDAVLITHTHADHIFGMDDLRQFNFRHKMDMPVYGTKETLEHLQIVFSYCFKETQAGGGKPRLDLRTINPYVPFEVCGVSITPLTVLHGKMPVTAFKFGRYFAYVTDASVLPGETRPYLEGLDTLVLGAVQYDPHPTHLGFYQALEVIRGLAPKRAFLTHLSHYLDYETANSEAPPNVRLGFDGLVFEVPGDEEAQNL